MQQKQRIALFLVAATIVMVIGSYYYYSNVMTWNDKIITSDGFYRLENDYSLSVSISSDHYVNFVLKNRDNPLVVSTNSANAYQKYEFLWESDHNRLWFNSSDIGTTVYIPDASNTYIKHQVTPKIYPDFEEPQILINDVPKSVRSKLRHYKDLEL